MPPLARPVGAQLRSDSNRGENMDIPLKPSGRSDCATVPAPPCTLVIFGAGGDLTKRLLAPTLYNLAGSGLLSEELTILGLDRLDHTDESWAATLTETMQSFTHDTTAEFHAAQIDPRA
jgi:glucose-6-phosphate 1-dehydrogenase